MKTNSKGYRDLVVWQKAVDLVVLVYEVTDTFPKNEQFGLTSQTRRAAVSIPANIAGGQKRSTKKDFVNFLRIAYGSGAELDTHLEIAHRLKYTNNNQLQPVNNRLEEVLKMLATMIRLFSGNYQLQTSNSS